MRKMRLPSKKVVVLSSTFILILPVFMLQMRQHGHAKTTQREEEVAKVIPKPEEKDCVATFKSLTMRKQLHRALVLNDPDAFMYLVQKNFPKCWFTNKEYSSYGYGLIEPKIFKKPIKENIISNTSLLNDKSWKKRNATLKMVCPDQSPLLQGHIDVDILENKPELRKVEGNYFNWPLTLEELASLQKENLRLGGFYPGPKDCKCRGYNAIIVPYRDRVQHLRYFLYYIHQILQRQQLCYIVIVSEQDDSNTFNKGQLMNTAFEYARGLMSFDCYIFHDVDVIAEDDRVLYTCREDKIMHYAPFIDKYNYKSNAAITVGAAVGFTEEQFLTVNGYSNEYAGWGGEDDDMEQRIAMKNIEIWRPTQNHTRFRMIKHGSDPGNKINQHRFQRLKMSKLRQKLDGVNSLDTLLEDNIQYITHTRLKVKTYKTGLQKDLERDNRYKVEKSKLNIGIPHFKRAGPVSIQVYTPEKLIKSIHP